MKKKLRKKIRATTKPVQVSKKKKRVNGCVKGKVGEREFVDFLKERGITARRGQQYEGSSDSPDVIAGGCLTGYHLEIKRKEGGTTAVYSWLDQAAGDADLCKVPVVAHRTNGKRWVVVMDARDFINLVKENYDVGKLNKDK